MENKMFEKLNLNPFFNYKNYEVKYKVILQEIFSRRKHLFDYTNDEILLEVMNFCNNVNTLEYRDVDADVLGFYLPSEEKSEGKIVLNKTKIEELQKESPFESISLEIFNLLSSSVSHAVLDDRRTGEFGLYKKDSFDKVEVLDELVNKAFALLVTGEDNPCITNKYIKIVKLLDIIAASFGFTRVEFLKLANLKRTKFEEVIGEKLGSKDATLDIINCFSLNLALLYSAISGNVKNNDLDDKSARRNILNAIASVYSISIIAMNTRLKNTAILDDISLFAVKTKKEFSVINKLVFDLMDELNLTLDEKEIIYASLNEYLESLNMKNSVLDFVVDNLHVLSQDDIELLTLAITEKDILPKVNEMALKYEISFVYEPFNYKKYIEYQIEETNFEYDNSEIIEYIDSAFNLDKIRKNAQILIEEKERENNVSKEELIKVQDSSETFQDEYSQIDQIIDKMFLKEEDAEATKTVPVITEEKIEEEISEENTEENTKEIVEVEDEYLQTALSRQAENQPYEDDLDKGILDCLKPKEGSKTFSLEQIIANSVDEEDDDYEEVEEEQGENKLFNSGKKLFKNIKEFARREKVNEEELEELEEIEEPDEFITDVRFNHRYGNDLDDTSNYSANIAQEDDEYGEDIDDDIEESDDYEESFTMLDALKSNLSKLSNKIKHIFEKKNDNMLPPARDEEVFEVEETEEIIGLDILETVEQQEEVSPTTRRVRKGSLKK